MIINQSIIPLEGVAKTIRNVYFKMFTLEFTLRIVPTMGFGRCMMTCIHHYQWNILNIRLLSLYSKPTRLVSLGFGVWELAYIKALCVMLTCR